MELIPRRLIVALGLLVLVLFAGTAGYILIEKWDLFDSFYMTVITLTTVGYGEVRPLSTDGRVFTMALLLSGFGILTYGITSGLAFLLEGELGHIMRRRKMDKQIEGMNNHYIICARGETGEYVIEEFMKTSQPVVVVTLDAKIVEKLSKTGVPVINDNSSEDEILTKAGIGRASGLITVLGEDKDNLFVVLSARGLNPGIKIVSQAIENSTVVKLKKAGADEVVLTDAIGGMRIASAMLRPTVVSFLDSMLRDAKGTLRVEEAVVAERSHLEDKTLAHSGISEKTGLVVVAVRSKATGAYTHNPGAHHKLSAGDTLIVIGDPDQVTRLNQLAAQP